jgi:hypothetical protein
LQSSILGPAFCDTFQTFEGTLLRDGGFHRRTSIFGFVSLDMARLLHSTGCAGSVRKARGLDNKESA